METHLTLQAGRRRIELAQQSKTKRAAEAARLKAENAAIKESIYTDATQPIFHPIPHTAASPSHPHLYPPHPVSVPYPAYLLLQEKRKLTLAGPAKTDIDISDEEVLLPYPAPPLLLPPPPTHPPLRTTPSHGRWAGCEKSSRSNQRRAGQWKPQVKEFTLPDLIRPDPSDHVESDQPFFDPIQPTQSDLIRSSQTQLASN